MANEIPFTYITISTFVGTSVGLGGKIIFDWLKNGRNGKKANCDPTCKESVSTILRRSEEWKEFERIITDSRDNSREQTRILRDIKTVIDKNNDLFHEFLGRMGKGG